MCTVRLRESHSQSLGRVPGSGLDGLWQGGQAGSSAPGSAPWGSFGVDVNQTVCRGKRFAT